LNDRDVELAIIQARREALLTSYGIHAGRWQGAQAAVLGLEALAVFGWFTGALAPLALTGLVALGTAGFLGIRRAMRRLDEEFEEAHDGFVSQYERLKGAGRR
jgi:hypothetical protein